MNVPKTPRLAKKVFPRLIWNKSRNEREVYLTFDDGPTPEVTEFVLSVLDQYCAKASFFCLGKNVVLYPDIFEKVRSEGHTIGNHTYNHRNAWNCKKEVYLQDVEHCEKVFHSKLFRPPYGKLKPGLRSTLLQNYDIIMWDVLSYDFDQEIEPERCFDYVRDNVQPGSIIVFHDSKKAYRNLKECLPKVMKYLSQEGYKMKAL